MNAGNNIPQTMSTKFGVKGKNIPQIQLKEVKATCDSRTYVYYLKLIKDEISEQFVDQLPKSYINPVGFDGIRIQAEIWNPEPGKWS